MQMPSRAQYLFGAGVIVVAAVGLSVVDRSHQKADRVAAAAKNLQDTFALLADCPRPDQSSPCFADPPPPHVVQLIPVKLARAEPPAQDETTQEAALEPDQPADDARGQHRGGDICARTGGRRVELRGGRSWRCVYARR